MSTKHYPYMGGSFDRIIFDGDGSVWVPESGNAKQREQGTRSFDKVLELGTENSKMSWSIEERIGEFRPFPAQVVVYKGNTDECLAYVSGEVADRLKAENAKLRELVRDMWSAYHNDATNKEFRSLPDRMRELGVDI